MPDEELPQPRRDTICGVDRDVVERFLVLVRDNYPKADAAAFFMEEVAHVEHKVTLVNLRDVLSHLATLLDGDTPPEQWEAQLAEAAAHFRRATQEPYQIALGHLRERFDTVRPCYSKILPRIQRLKRGGLFDGAPTDEVIEHELKGIVSLALEGREAKRGNRTDPAWDHGFGSHAEAYDKLEKLTQRLSTILHQYDALRSTHWSRAGVLIGVIGAVMGIVGIVLFVLSHQ